MEIFDEDRLKRMIDEVITKYKKRKSYEVYDLYNDFEFIYKVADDINSSIAIQYSIENLLELYLNGMQELLKNFFLLYYRKRGNSFLALLPDNVKNELLYYCPDE